MILFFKIFFFFLFSLKLSSSERYICKYANESNKELTTNFYVINEKVIMSGMSGSGEYNILNKNHNGLFAINSSFIGNDYGIETILIDNVSKKFIYKSKISNNNKNNFIEIKGYCKFLN